MVQHGLEEVGSLNLQPCKGPCKFTLSGCALLHCLRRIYAYIDTESKGERGREGERERENQINVNKTTTNGCMRVGLLQRIYGPLMKVNLDS